jgi:hypothetical protein
LLTVGAIAAKCSSADMSSIWTMAMRAIARSGPVPRS